jgi:hypothetical protein
VFSIFGPASASFTSWSLQAASAIPTTTDLFSCVVSSTKCTLTDSGVPSGNVVQASSPGAGIAHFAGSTQAVTSSAVNLANSDVTGLLPSANIAPGTTFQTGGYNGNSGIAPTANHTYCVGFTIPPGGLSVGHISIYVETDDASNNSDVGIYTGSPGGTGTLRAHIGAQTTSSTGSQNFAFSGGTQTIPGGPGWLCFTTASTHFNFSADANAQTFYQLGDISATATSGGVLNSTVTLPGVSINTSGQGPQFVLYP